MKSFKEMFNSLENHCDPQNTVVFDWTAKGIGFGQIYFYLDETDGNVHCENECMSREFLKEMLCTMIDNCILNDPGDSDTTDVVDGRLPGYSPKPIE